MYVYMYYTYLEVAQAGFVTTAGAAAVEFEVAHP